MTTNKVQMTPYCHLIRIQSLAMIGSHHPIQHILGFSVPKTKIFGGSPWCYHPSWPHWFPSIFLRVKMTGLFLMFLRSSPISASVRLPNPYLADKALKQNMPPSVLFTQLTKQAQVMCSEPSVPFPPSQSRHPRAGKSIKFMALAPLFYRWVTLTTSAERF